MTSLRKYIQIFELRNLYLAHQLRIAVPPVATVFDVVGIIISALVCQLTFTFCTAIVEIKICTNSVYSLDGWQVACGAFRALS